jgi:hypothetical protein
VSGRGDDHGLWGGASVVSVGRPDAPPRKAALPLFEAEAAKRKAQAPGESRGAKKSLGADLPHENEAVLEALDDGFVCGTCGGDGRDERCSTNGNADVEVSVPARLVASPRTGVCP